MEMRDVPDAIGYKVTACGKVFSFHRLKPFELKTSKHPQGYRQVNLKTGEKTYRSRLVHVIVLTAWAGPRPYGAVINHKNGDKTDNRLENLEYCTQTKNMKHSYENGLSPKPPEFHGSACRLSKLTEEKVLQIRAETDREEGYTTRIAAKYGVTAPTVSKILRRQTWKHI
jgi:hypothetical protein